MVILLTMYTILGNMADQPIGGTNFNLPGQVGEVYRGKVADVYTLEHEAGDLLAVVRTDRISAYDVVLPQLIPFKGQVLNEMSAHFLQATSEVAPNWFITAPDPNVSVGYRAEPIKVEMIMRGFLLGSSWKKYLGGSRDISGNELPDGMEEFQPFDIPLLTPTTKAEEGHDEDISIEQIVERGLATFDECIQMGLMSYHLFDAGQQIARERGLLLADTKYEFGRLATGEVVVIDEVHTPDSSRYFPADQFSGYDWSSTSPQIRPEQMSKEFVREKLAELGFTGQPGEVPPELSLDFRADVIAKYISLYTRMLNKPFVPADFDQHPLARIEGNILDFLSEF